MGRHREAAATRGVGPIAGCAAGVPFLAIPPAGGARASAPVVLAWHLLDAPRTEAAFAAAVPLRGLDAWRVFLGLPLTGSRLPDGGFEELGRRGASDAVRQLYRPIVCDAVAELPAAWAALREQLGIEAANVGLMGGSAGAAVALLALAEADLAVRAAVLVSPLVRLRAAVDAAARLYGAEYHWTKESLAVADRLDFVARAGDLAAGGAALLLIVGEEDDAHFLDAATALHKKLHAHHHVDAGLATVEGMAHALAEEPGTGQARQLPHAAAVDRLAVDWFDRHLLARPHEAMPLQTR